MQTRMNVQQEGTIVSTTVLILPAASDVVALMDTWEMEWHVLVSQLPLFIYLTYTLLTSNHSVYWTPAWISNFAFENHLRSACCHVWGAELGTVSESESECWKSWRSGTRSDSSIADMLQKSRCCKSTFLLSPLEDKWGKDIFNTSRV